jgi:hypothetical protein
MNLSGPVNKFTDWERFQSLVSELISSRIQINSGEEADKGAHDFTASIVLGYGLSASNHTLPDLNKYLPGLESLLKEKRMFRKLWKLNRDPTCKTAVKWIALERWETKVGNCEVTPQALWPIAKSVMKKDG